MFEDRSESLNIQKFCPLKISSYTDSSCDLS